MGATTGGCSVTMAGRAAAVWVPGSVAIEVVELVVVLPRHRMARFKNHDRQLHPGQAQPVGVASSAGLERGEVELS